MYPHLQDTQSELVHLHKPTDLTYIDYSPLQHLSRSLDDYMTSMKK